MNNKYEKIIGWLAGLIVLGILLWGFMSSMESKAPVVPEPEPVQQTPQVQTLEEYLKAPMLSAAETADWKTYTSANFLIKYPKDFKINANFIHEIGLGQEYHGVSFTIPESLTTGTNLSKDSSISVEENPNIVTCEAREFIDVPNTQISVVVNGKTYTTMQFSDAGAGNFYDETIVAVPGTPCRGIRLLIHSTNIGNYDPGTIKEFDKSALLSIFATMAASYNAK